MPRSKKSAEPAPAMNIVRIDGRKIVDQKSFHDVLAQAFGFPKSYGKNLDALVDCLTYLDDPTAAMSTIQVPPGNVLTVLLDAAGILQATHRDLYDAIMDAIAFVNYRRIEKGRAAVLTVAYAKN